MSTTFDLRAMTQISFVAMVLDRFCNGPYDDFLNIGYYPTGSLKFPERPGLWDLRIYGQMFGEVCPIYLS